jgi:hypothetical protein
MAYYLNSPSDEMLVIMVRAVVGYWQFLIYDAAVWMILNEKISMEL